MCGCHQPVPFPLFVLPSVGSNCSQRRCAYPNISETVKAQELSIGKPTSDTRSTQELAGPALEELQGSFKVT